MEKGQKPGMKIVKESFYFNQIKTLLTFCTEHRTVPHIKEGVRVVLVKISDFWLISLQILGYATEHSKF